MGTSPSQMPPAPPTTTPSVTAPPSPGAQSQGGSLGERIERLLDARPYLRHAGLLVAVGMAAVLYTHKLAQNGYANLFYSAGVEIGRAHV